MQQIVTKMDAYDYCGESRYGSSDDVANRLIKQIVKKHPSAVVLSCKTIDVGKFWSGLVKVVCKYDE